MGERDAELPASSFQNGMAETEIEAAAEGLGEAFQFPGGGLAPTLGGASGSEPGGPFGAHIALHDIAAEQETAVEGRDAGGGFGGEERPDSSGLGGFTHLTPIVATGNGSGGDGFADDGGEACQTEAPFAIQVWPGESGHAGGVGAGVAADDMTAAVEIPDFGLREEAGGADAVRGDEEVAAPTALFEEGGDGVVEARAAIVERKS